MMTSCGFLPVSCAHVVHLAPAKTGQNDSGFHPAKQPVYLRGEKPPVPDTHSSSLISLDCVFVFFGCMQPNDWFPSCTTRVH